MDLFYVKLYTIEFDKDFFRNCETNNERTV